MVACQIESRPDMYGLGIRLAFYANWFGTILMETLDETELRDLRFLGLLLTSAQALSLIIQVAQDDLAAGNIYIAYLLALGTFAFLIPVYVWRGVMLCNPYWNPLRWSKERQSPIYRFSFFVVLVSVASVGTWFWTTYLPALNSEGCTGYGFFFSKVSLENTAYIAYNSIVVISILVVCFVILVMAIGWVTVRIWPKEAKRRKVRKTHLQLLRTLRTMAYLAVFAVLIAAIELSIQWNLVNTSSTNDLSSSAQLIPLILSAGVVVRVLFFHFADLEAESDDGSVRRVVVQGEVKERRRVVVDERGGWPGPPPSARTRG